MKCNRNFKSNLTLCFGLILNSIYLTANCILEPKGNLIHLILGAVEGLALVLLTLGILQATPQGKAILQRVRRCKCRLFRGRREN